MHGSDRRGGELTRWRGTPGPLFHPTAITDEPEHKTGLRRVSGSCRLKSRLNFKEQPITGLASDRMRGENLDRSYLQEGFAIRQMAEKAGPNYITRGPACRIAGFQCPPGARWRGGMDFQAHAKLPL